MPASQNPLKYLIPKKWIINAIFIIAFTALYYALTQKTVTEPAFDIPYSEFKQLLNDGALASVTLKGNRAEGTLVQATDIGPQQEMSRYFKTRIPDIGDESLLPTLETQRVEVQAFPPETEGGLWRMLLSMLPWIFIIAFWFWIIKRAQGKYFRWTRWQRRIGGNFCAVQPERLKFPISLLMIWQVRNQLNRKLPK